MKEHSMEESEANGSKYLPVILFCSGSFLIR